MRFFVFFMILSCSWQAYAKASYSDVIPDTLILDQAMKYGAYDPYLVLAIAKQESGGNRMAHNRHDPAYGLMQLKLGTARILGFTGKWRELFDWKVNLKLGVTYLNKQIERYKDLPSALAAYNAGSAFICRKGKNGCKIGHFVNQKYVDIVTRRYRAILQKTKRMS